MIKKIMLFLFYCFFSISSAIANNHIILPKKTIYYHCKCNTPNAQGICHAYKKDGVTRSAKSTPIALTLSGGWIIQPAYCINKQKYILSAGAVFFTGKKIAALYDKLKPPLSNVGYVYHVTPTTTYAQKSYSIVVVRNTAIHGIDLKDNQWECGYGNAHVSCHSNWISARCFAGNACYFTYDDK